MRCYAPLLLVTRRQTDKNAAHLLTAHFGPQVAVTMSGAAGAAAAAPDGAQAPPSDEEMRKLLKPNPTDEEVLAVLSKTYPTMKLKIVKELDSYDDKNYLVIDTANDETRYLAKVHNGVESLDYINKHSSSSSHTSVVDLQNAIFSHINSVEGVTTSAPIPPPPTLAAEDGAVISLHDLPVMSLDHSPSKLVVRLLTWVPGVPLSSVPSTSLTAESLADAGAYLGKLRRALDDLAQTDANAVQASKRYHVWDGRNTLDLTNFTKYIADEDRRGLVHSVLGAFRDTFGEDGSKVDFPEGILMGDYNDANILIDGGKVSGVIDFGDSVHSWRVLDISIAMAYALLTNLGKAKRSLSAAASMLRGFNSIYPLTDLEMKHLRLLVASRLACSVTLGAYSYQQNPENEYLLLHAQPAWDALGIIWGRGKSGAMAKAIDNLFRAACTTQPPVATNETIDCSDIAMPDPDVHDVLASVRTQVTSIGAGEGVDGDEPPAKKAKVDAAKTPIITFVTGNKKKLEEVKRILSTDAGDGSGSGLPFELTNHKIDLPELQGDTLLIAKEKCALAAEKVGGAVITEDTSLCYNALRGLPGPYCKWFLDSTGLQGLNDMLAFTDDKSAYAQTVVAFCPGPGLEVLTFDGRTQGKIVAARGDLAFGWDPVFEPTEGGGLTYAEMTKEGKDAISHRSRAFAQLRDFFHREEESVKNSILS